MNLVGVGVSVCRVAKEVGPGAIFGCFLAKVFVSMLSRYSWKAVFDLVSIARMPLVTTSCMLEPIK